MTPAVQGQSAIGRVVAALQMSFLQTSLAPKATSNWSGKSRAKTEVLSLQKEMHASEDLCEGLLY